MLEKRFHLDTTKKTKLVLNDVTRKYRTIIIGEIILQTLCDVKHKTQVQAENRSIRQGPSFYHNKYLFTAHFQRICYVRMLLWTYLIVSLFLWFCEFVKGNCLEYVLIPPGEQDHPFQIHTKHFKIFDQNAYLAIVKGAIPPKRAGMGAKNGQETSKPKVYDSHSDAHSRITVGTNEESKNHFGILVRDSKCSLQKSSTFAKQSKCSYAVNGGPFHSYIHGGCVGLTVSNGMIINGGGMPQTQGKGQEEKQRQRQNHLSSSSVCAPESPELELPSSVFDADAAFGVTKDNEWIIGNVQNFNQSNLQELITGLNGWLLYNSTVVVPSQGASIRNQNNRRNQGFFDARAPRTAIGIDKSGNDLVLLQVDGCEHCPTAFHKNKNGLTMYEMANAMNEYADYAINLDGGGSSTSVNDGHVWNRPTCLDYVDVQCERPVASVICIH